MKAVLPDKKYSIIYADPPWSYRDSMKAGERGVEFKYQTMSDQDILDLPVASISNDNCWLFLWATFPRIETALKVFPAWGFQYKTLGFNWVKTNKVQTNKVFWGCGNYTRSCSEVCLLGTKGKPKRISTSVHSQIIAPVGRHSAKPAVVRDRIIQLCGDLPRIELFAREMVSGWDYWGNEVE
jgi:N6-adenosine-specific RNA methylase IME4